MRKNKSLTEIVLEIFNWLIDRNAYDCIFLYSKRWDFFCRASTFNFQLTHTQLTCKIFKQCCLFTKETEKERAPCIPFPGELSACHSPALFGSGHDSWADLMQCCDFLTRCRCPQMGFGSSFLPYAPLPKKEFVYFQSFQSSEF